MELSRNLSYLMIKSLFYGLVGLVIFITAAVVLSLASVLIVIAMVGFLLWLPVHSLVTGNHVRIFRSCEDAFGNSWRFAGGCIGRAKYGLRVCRNTLKLAQCRFQSVTPCFLELICGAFLGCFLALIRESGFVVNPFLLVMGGVLGGAAGAVVAWASIQSEKAN